MTEAAAGTLKLKNGAEHDARSAYVKWCMLTAIADRQPQHMAALIALARGVENSVTAELRSTLQQSYVNWFDGADRLQPVIQDVLLSAVLDTAEGFVVTNPFIVNSPDERRLFESIQRHDDRLLRRLRGRGDDSPGHSIC